MTIAQDRLAELEAGPRVPYDLDAPLDALVGAQAARTPSRVALSDARQRIAYDRMWREAGGFAAMLQGHGVGRETVVAVCAERSVHLPVALLGVLRAGGAYCPLDPEQPVQRLRHMVEQARPAVIVTAPRFEAHVTEAARWAGCAIVVLGDGGELGFAAAGDPPAERAFDRDDPAYVIFTSGSSGRPKGVVVPHRGVVNRLLWMQDALELGADDIVLQKTPYGFDVSVWELFWPLIAGAREHLAAPDGHRDPRYLTETIAREQVTTVHFVPSMLTLFLEDPLAAECRSLRRVIASGEALPGPLMLRALETLAPARLFNLYGPTEASIDVTWWECAPQPASAPVPIGRPIANVDVHLLDGDGNRVPAGEPGELCIGGVGVALGYASQPRLTAERFVELPGIEGRVYRTGDRARWRDDGTLDYLGRIDQQVKLNGVRIELGEIEAVMRQMPEIVDVAVAVASDARGSDRLVAYVVPRGDGLDRAELHRRLTATLPADMIPAFAVTLPALPTTSSGKLARDALPPPAREDRMQRATDRRPASTGTTVPARAIKRGACT
ncbi:MAG TPA: amino acid adenylation domain-containing protein [Thermoleophilaceae bacterium]|jgi:amino acid adenylation domain-containing protein